MQIRETVRFWVAQGPLKNEPLAILAITLLALAGCSRENELPTASRTPSTSPQDSAPVANDSTQGSVALLNIYSIRLNDTVRFLVTEIENNGKTSIKAFRGTWTMTDDLGDKVTDDTIKFTGDTQFGTTNGLTTRAVHS
jgi:hypothetical protein